MPFCFSINIDEVSPTNLNPKKFPHHTVCEIAFASSGAHTPPVDGLDRSEMSSSFVSSSERGRSTFFRGAHGESYELLQHLGRGACV